MGIESDKLVYDYLGRVADLAQTSLPAADRARLIAGLRADIDSRRATARDTPAAVRKVLERLGPPDQVVERAARQGPPSAPGPSVPAPAAVPGPVPPPGPGPSVPAGPPASPGPSVPTLPATRDAEWWRVPGAAAAAVPEAEDGPVQPAHLPTAEDFPGWDGVEIRFEAEQRPPAAAAPAAPTAEPEAEPVLPVPAEKPGRRRLAAALRPPGPGRPPLLESAAAVLLLAGAVTGQLVVMLLGWLAAYASRRMSLPVRRFAVFGIPALAVLGAAVWLWGRTSGRWGGPPPTDAQFQAALKSLVPVVLRSAAAGSAVFLGWRALSGRTPRG
ncbi:hypothetical protein [Peterkaempfera sp. SMS 1(5)a]|uniref:HAAS signaling domain-containing protein n=1 Tax=Peterkaempfera podocarpi TaxID=3232308 RepID=UPI0036702F94